MSKKYDVIIIGGGNAGFGVSAIAAEAGKSIAFLTSLMAKSTQSRLTGSSMVLVALRM